MLKRVFGKRHWRGCSACKLSDHSGGHMGRVAFRGHTQGPVIFGKVLVTCVLIGGVVRLRIQSRLGLAPAPDARPGTENAFLKRLPYDLGRVVLSLSTQDNYVEVTTAKGATLVLIRFSDAMAELAGIDGMQIHRSHWVARQAARRLVRENGRPFVELIDGRRLPVSRTYLATVRGVLQATA